MWDEPRRRLVEPNAPYAPLGILHLAGEGQKEKSFTLATTDGDRMTTGLRYSKLRPAAPG
jgi:hypothetical protein